MTFAEAKKHAIEFIGNALVARSVDITPAVYGKQINVALAEFAQKTRVACKEFEITTVANDFDYTPDSKVIEVVSCRYKNSTYDIGKSLTPYPSGRRAIPAIKKSSSVPDYYWAEIAQVATDSRIGVWPVADTAGDTIVYTAAYIPTAMSGDSDVMPFQDPFNYACVLYGARNILAGHVEMGAGPGPNDRALIMKIQFAGQKWGEAIQQAISPPVVVEEAGYLE